MNQQGIQSVDGTDGEKLLSHYRTANNKYDEQIAVPVVDVRDGFSYRIMAMQMIKAARAGKSKFIPYNHFYQSSPKKRKSL